MKAICRIGAGLIIIFSALVLLPTSFAQAASAANGIVSPAAEAVVQGVVPVEAVAHHPGFRKWQLDLLVEGDAQRARFLAVSEEMQPEADVLTVLDTTRFPDGEHVLRLRVVYTGLQYDEFYTPIEIRNRNTSPALPDDQSSDQPQLPAAEILVAGDGVLGAGAPEGRRWVQVDISDQTLTAWQGDTVVLKTKVSTGKPGWRTLPGTFNVYVKYPQTRMTGPGYDTPNVPWTMYYYQGFAIHGAYWHNNFGTPVSHGCVNLPVETAKMLFDWADVGLEVVVVE